MKKSLLILSMMAVAATASAFDTPVAGTAEAPNYYIITANRGVPYLGYTAEGVTSNNGTTNLYRTNELTTANVWAVTPGATKGTVVIKNYTTDAYLLGFFDASGNQTTDLNATATTVNTPTELVLKDMGEAFAISLNSNQGYTTLDAPGGTSATCGNWVANSPESGEGGCWWFTKVTPAEGQSIEETLTEEALSGFQQTIQAELSQFRLEVAVANAVATSVTRLEAFILNVPQAQTQLQTGIEQLKTLPATEDYATKITEIENATIVAANEALATAFTDGTYAILNQLRANAPGTNVANEGAYLAVNTTNDKYGGSTSYTADAARFTFKAKDNGYLIYNPGTQTYIGAGASVGNAYQPQTDETAAQAFQIILHQHGGYFGVTFVSVATSNCAIHWQNWEGGNVSKYYYNGNNTDDDCTIFSIKPADDATIIAEATAIVESALSPYLANVPASVNTILNEAITEAKALTVSADIFEKAEAIRTKAITDANNALATELTNGTYAIFNPRRANTPGTTEGAYLAVNTTDNKYVGSTSYTSDVARFTFKAKDNGYLIYNPGTQTYIGATCTPVDEAAAQVFQVVLQQSDNKYFGVALVSDAANKQGINWQSWNNGAVSIYSIADGGSIFSIKPADDATIIAEAAATVESALTPYLANVPASVKTILNNAIAEAKALTFSADIFERAEAIRAKAIADANAELTTGLNGQKYVLKNLYRNGFVNCADNSFVITDESTAATAESAKFTFKFAADGGYTLYNAGAQSYVGPKASDSNALTIVSEESSAVVVYPVLMQSGDYYGISLCFNADHSGDGFHMNSDTGLLSYLATSGGSIWGLIEPATITGIESVPAAEKVAVEGIYDLSGRKLSAPVRGINIINGKKVFVR